MKPFSVKFKLDAQILAIIFICFKYKFPLSFMLAFYEMYEKNTLFVLKAMSCTKKISLNDNTFIKILQDSRTLYTQIIAGISTNIKRDRLISQVKNGKLITEIIPDCPEIQLKDFSDDYSQFITQYLINNVTDIFAEQIELQMDTIDLYDEIAR